MTYEEITTLINENLEDGSKIPASKHRAVEFALLDYIQSNLSQSGDIKPIKCDIAYLQANFETNGLGKNLRAGWAICNGNNGTENFAGRTLVAYGTEYTSLGGVGGVKELALTTAQMPKHKHEIYTTTYDLAGAGGGEGVLRNDLVGVSHSKFTQEVGSGEAHSNMQPYIIQLYIMKI